MKLKVFGTLRQLISAKQVEMEVRSGDTVRDALVRLAGDHGVLGERILDQEGNLQKAINVLVNGRSIHFLDGLDTTIQEGDELAIFPAVGGG
ncbi:MAG: MoaD/ThiS family protein [Anaerolineae bacterium]